MMRTFPQLLIGRFLAVLAAAAILVMASPAVAHCDAEDGPVAKDVSRALAAGEMEPMLKWINEDDEAELAAVFDQALRVRQTGDEAKAMADRYVLETAVRLHRMSEGAPYTGIKPAGQPLPAPVVAVDRAMEQGEIDGLIADLQEAVDREVRSRFNEARQSADVASQSVAHGRAAVHAYVELVHYVLGLHDMLHGAHEHAHGERAAEPDSPCCGSVAAAPPACDGSHE